LTIDGLVWFPQPTTEGHATNAFGFCSVHGILPYITTSFDGLSLFDGPDHLFDNSRQFFRKLCRFCVLFSCIFPFPFPNIE
jgi:hypothetical protein